MAKTAAFDRFTLQYEEWFERHRFAYISELKAIERVLPEKGEGIEIGVGTGRFAHPLGIKYGLEPSENMALLAGRRGIKIFRGTAENMPFHDATFDFVLITTTICFVDNIEKALKEVWRILKKGGVLIVGFIDRKSLIGRTYEQNKNKNVFYKDATFFSVDEIVKYIKKIGFKRLYFLQTLFHRLEEINTVEPIEMGYGKGGFVVIRAEKV